MHGKKVGQVVLVTLMYRFIYMYILYDKMFIILSRYLRSKAY